MGTSSHKKNKTISNGDSGIPDFSKSPFAMKKAERAQAFIAKNGLPKEFEIKKKKG